MPPLAPTKVKYVLALELKKLLLTAAKSGLKVPKTDAFADAVASVNVMSRPVVDGVGPEVTEVTDCPVNAKVTLDTVGAAVLTKTLSVAAVPAMPDVLTACATSVRSPSVVDETDASLRLVARVTLQVPVASGFVPGTVPVPSSCPLVLPE